MAIVAVGSDREIMARRDPDATDHLAVIAGFALVAILGHRSRPEL
jgi:hypothetical protein